MLLIGCFQRSARRHGAPQVDREGQQSADTLLPTVCGRTPGVAGSDGGGEVSDGNSRQRGGDVEAVVGRARPLPTRGVSGEKRALVHQQGKRAQLRVRKSRRIFFCFLQQIADV